MKLAQYTMREAQIITTDANGIRQRWMWGLRVLHDPQMFSNGSTQLKPGITEALIQAAAKRSIKLSAREIQRRLQCARTYRTETEFRHAVAKFECWRDLANANFPPYESSYQPLLDEPPADWRTETEKNHDRMRAYLDMTSGMDAMFPLSQFEPVVTTLEDLEIYEKQQITLTEEIHRNHLATHARRREYLNGLEAAVNGDLSVTWQDAHRRAFGGGDAG